jgi:hypothetical protein
MAGFVRICCCLLLFGVGAEALGGGDVGLIGSAIVAFAVNRVWREQQREQARAEHRRDVIADEELRADVRERRAQAERVGGRSGRGTTCPPA